MDRASRRIKIIKIVLDVIMTVLLLLMYQARVISITFHELGGLIACGIFLIHKLINWRWIAAVSKRLFKKKFSFKLRFCYVIDLLLLIGITAILVSGILISKVVFTNLSVTDAHTWKIVHYSASAYSLIIVGIHLGLHWCFVTGMFKRLIKLPAVLSKVLSLVLVLAIAVYGGYSVVTSSFAGWLTLPFESLETQTVNGNSDYIDPLDSTRGVESDALIHGSDDDAELLEEHESAELDSHIIEDGVEGGHGLGGGNGHGNGMGRSGEESAGTASVLLTYGSIIGLFTVLTYYIEKLLWRQSHKRRLLQAGNQSATPHD